MWAFLFPYQTLMNALLAERVSTDSGPTINDKVHANAASQAIDLAHAFLNSLFQFFEFLFSFFNQLLFLADLFFSVNPLTLALHFGFSLAASA